MNLKNQEHVLGQFRISLLLEIWERNLLALHTRAVIVHWTGIMVNNLLKRHDRSTSSGPKRIKILESHLHCQQLKYIAYLWFDILFSNAVIIAICPTIYLFIW